MNFWPLVNPVTQGLKNPLVRSYLQVPKTAQWMEI